MLLDSTTPEMISSLLEEAVDSLPEKQAMVFQIKIFRRSKIQRDIKTAQYK